MKVIRGILKPDRTDSLFVYKFLLFVTEETAKQYAGPYYTGNYYQSYGTVEKDTTYYTIEEATEIEWMLTVMKGRYI